MLKVRFCLSQFMMRFLGLLPLLFSLPACSPAPSAPALIPITFQLSWTHGAQFAGFYAAEQNGYYAAEGLAVTFVEGGSQVERLPAVLEGKVQLGMVGGPEAITARAEGKPIRVVAAILQHDPFAFFTLADSGITRPEDFAGKVIQVRDRSRPFLHAMTNKVGLDPDQYREDTEAVFDDLFSGRIDVAIGFVTSQMLEAEQAGYELNIIYPDDYGVHFYSDLIFTTDAFIAAQPDLITRFLRASFEGWRFILENSDQVGPLLQKYQPELDAELEELKLIASLPFINTGENYIGWMKPEVWKGMERTLREENVLQKPLDITQVYTLRFLQNIYP